MHFIHCNFIYIKQVPLSGYSEGTFAVFESRWHLPTCLPQTVEASRFVLLFPMTNVKQHVAYSMPFFSLGLTQLEIKPEFTVLKSNSSIYSTTDLPD